MNSFAFLFIALIGASNALIANTLHNSIKPLPTSRFYQSRLTETTCNYKLRYGVGNFSGSLSILPTVGLNNDWCSFEILCDVKRGCDIDLTVKFSGSLNVWTDGNMIFEVADHFATQKQVLYTSKVNNATIVYKPGNNRLNPQESAFSIAYYSKNAGLRALSALCALIALLVFALSQGCMAKRSSTVALWSSAPALLRGSKISTKTRLIWSNSRLSWPFLKRGLRREEIELSPPYWERLVKFDCAVYDLIAWK